METISYGAGTRTSGASDYLRLYIGKKIRNTDYLKPALTCMYFFVETNLVEPKIYNDLFDLLLEAGADDLFSSPVYKKGLEVGSLLFVTCSYYEKQNLIDLINGHFQTRRAKVVPVDFSELNKYEIAENRFGSIHY